MYLRKLLKRQMIISLTTFIAVILIAVTSTYAYYSGKITDTGDPAIEVNSANLVITYNSGNEINNQNIEPMTDAVALTQNNNIYTFSIKNTGTIPNNYTIKVKNDPTYLSGGSNYNSSRVLLGHQYIRYKFQTGANATLSNLSGGILETGTIAVNETKSYTLRLWVGDAATYNLPNSALSSEIHLNIEVEGKTIAQ